MAMVFTIKVALLEVTTLSFNTITGECKATLVVEEPQKKLFRDVRKETWMLILRIVLKTSIELNNEGLK